MCSDNEIMGSYYLVQTAANVDGRRLDHVINDFGKGCEEIGRVYFWVKEDFRGQKTLVAHIDGIFLAMY
jgi:hypothetical protein